MSDRKTVSLRDRLRGKTLATFDILADCGPVDIGLLYESLSGRDRTSPREMRKYLGPYRAGLNRALIETGQQVRSNGHSTYILGRRSGRGDAELKGEVAQINTMLANGIVPGSPTSRRARRRLARLCEIPAKTVSGAVARDELRLLPEFQYPLDQARLQRAAVRDVGVFW